MNYYNENNLYTAKWLENLIEDKIISQGVVDTRSIEDVKPSELIGYTQCHFFAGIGGWSIALRLAGWPDNQPVWTGSCPCQPFSPAGKRKGITDERHLWPAFHWLITQCAPNQIFGEQVISNEALSWFDTLSNDLESFGYSVGAANICAASVGAPHIRNRLYWVATNTHPISISQRNFIYEETTNWKDEFFRQLVAAEIQLSVPTGKYSALVDGVLNRAFKLRAYGNAIVPQVAAEFIKSIYKNE